MNDIQPIVLGEFTEYKPPSWDELFMRMVYTIASKSKDPRTKIGAVVVKGRHAPLQGFNGIPAGVSDVVPERFERPEKYHWMEHAERNVINMAARLGISTEGGTLYTQGLPCVDCARGVVNAGIKEIVLHKQWEDISTTLTNGRPWTEHYHRSMTMFNESGINVRFLDKLLKVEGFLDGKVLLI